MYEFVCIHVCLYLCILVYVHVFVILHGRMCECMLIFSRLVCTYMCARGCACTRIYFTMCPSVYGCYTCHKMSMFMNTPIIVPVHTFACIFISLGML